MLIKLICFMLAVLLAESSGDLMVSLKNGTVKGFLRTAYYNNTFVAFEGIPYAKPPIGNLRFEEPQPAESWSGILNANRKMICTQYFPMPGSSSALQGMEDCLYINVYVPGEEIDTGAEFDVVVHIHGGAFVVGSPATMAEATYIMTKNVIYVSFSYRLGIFGFLSTEDDVVPGNNGLKDQNLALRWIQENIADFGGNPNSVTLTGLSAGSASVHLHTLSPKSKGLFYRGVCTSGSALNPWVLTENSLDKANKLGKIMQCPTNTSKELVDCLKKADVKDLGLAIGEFFTFMNLLPFTPFGPVIEKGLDPFLGKHPYKSLLDGELSNDVPLIMSCVKDEGIIAVGFFELFGKLDEISENWLQFAPSVLDFHDTIRPEFLNDAAKKIKEFYFKDGKIDENNKKKFIKAFSDRLFLNGIEMAARMQAKIAKSNIYFYYFSYELEQTSIFPTKGVAHLDDSKLIFQSMPSPTQLPENDEAMMNFMTDMIYNFGRENKPVLPQGSWNPVSKDEGKLDYLHIYSSDKYMMESIDELSANDFWKTLNIQENENLFKD